MVCERAHAAGIRAQSPGARWARRAGREGRRITRRASGVRGRARALGADRRTGGGGRAQGGTRGVGGPRGGGGGRARSRRGLRDVSATCVARDRLRARGARAARRERMWGARALGLIGHKGVMCGTIVARGRIAGVETTPWIVGISKVPLEQDEAPAARSPQGAGATQETTDTSEPRPDVKTQSHPLQFRQAQRSTRSHKKGEARNSKACHIKTHHRFRQHSHRFR